MTPRPCNRLCCPSCGSYRITGDRFRFKCKVCGFIHNSVPESLLKKRIIKF